MLQAARRITEGEIPYRDFLWVYGPGQPYVLAGAFEGFGVSLLPWRLLRVAADAGVALVVFVVVRREAGWRWALGPWAVAAVTMAQPTGAYPFPIALLLTMAAVGVAGARLGRRQAVLAAALTAGAAAWRFDFAAYGGVAVIVTLLIHAEPWGARLRASLLYAAASTALGVLLYLPFAIAAGPGVLVESLVAAGARGRQGLPFPLAYDGPFRLSSPQALAEDVKDVVGFYVPLTCILGLALAALVPLVRRRRPPPTLAGLLVLGLGYLIYFLSRADEFHVQPLAVVVAVAIPVALVHAGHGRTPRAFVAFGAAVLAFLLGAGVANRASALLLPPTLETIDVPVADGVKAPPATAKAIERTVSLVQIRVPPGEPIYVANSRSDRLRINNPLLYVLAERHNPYGKDFGPLTTGPAQREIVETLRDTKPRVVVRWTDPESTKTEPNRSAVSSGVRILDRHLAARYRLLSRFGFYDVLVPRRTP